jgi:molecular chaperone IbpA
MQSPTIRKLFFCHHAFNFFYLAFDAISNSPVRLDGHMLNDGIERLGDDRYQISLAPAGFSPDEIAITAEQNVLTIEGRKADDAKRDYLYRGISAKGFKRQFNLADYVQVKTATFDNGLLRIELVRELPEAMKPRRVPIGAAEQVTHEQAA